MFASVARSLLVVFALGLAACGGQAATAAENGAGPKLPVATRTLAEAPVEDFDDYLGSLTSRRSITLYAQVTGYVRAIGVKPGQPAKRGALLVEIDPSQQEATLKGLAANIETRRAALGYATQNDESSKGLVDAGLLSQLDYQQRHSARVAAEADVKAAQASLQAQRELLRFYRVTAPTDGVVGDVPVKIGDYVTPQTRLTSVDQDDLVEAYVYVPTGKVASIKPESAIRLVGDDGKVLCEQKPTFVSPQVAVDTQTVLVKTVCPNAGALRTAQVLKARFVWARHPGLLVPIAAVTRLAGQYFAWVVENGVAKQRPITVGDIVGNDFVVRGGLKAGDTVVVSNLQKLRDGAPIDPKPEAAPAPSSSAP